MDKIMFTGLNIEITRRCNMGCQHCMRGESENKDIDLSYIDAVLDQADAIGNMTFTGGEPLLCMDTMEYVAKGLQRRGIILFSLEMNTNGSIYDKKFVEIIKQYREIINISCKQHFVHDPYGPMQETSRICIGVSLDKYHTNHDKCEDSYQRYKEDLNGIADVIRIRHGNAPIRVGRATALPDSTDLSCGYPIAARQRVEVLDENHTPICYVFEKFKLIKPDQKIICCNLYLSADGFVRHGVCGDLSFQMIDNFPAICKATEPIWDSVLRYGADKISCVESSHEQMEAHLKDDFQIKECIRRAQLQNAPEAQDELTMQEEKEKRQLIIEAINKGNFYDQEITIYKCIKEIEDAIKKYHLDWQDIAKQSSEYHHGSGKLPPEKRPKPEQKVNIARVMRRFTPDKSVRCMMCGKVIINREGRKIHITDDNRCEYCHTTV